MYVHVYTCLGHLALFALLLHAFGCGGADGGGNFECMFLSKSTHLNRGVHVCKHLVIT